MMNAEELLRNIWITDEEGNDVSKNWCWLLNNYWMADYAMAMNKLLSNWQVKRTGLDNFFVRKRKIFHKYEDVVNTARPTMASSSFPHAFNILEIQINIDIAST